MTLRDRFLGQYSATERRFTSYTASWAQSSRFAGPCIFMVTPRLHVVRAVVSRVGAVTAPADLRYIRPHRLDFSPKGNYVSYSSSIISSTQESARRSRLCATNPARLSHNTTLIIRSSYTCSKSSHTQTQVSPRRSRTTPMRSLVVSVATPTLARPIEPTLFEVLARSQPLNEYHSCSGTSTHPTPTKALRELHEARKNH